MGKDKKKKDKKLKAGESYTRDNRPKGVSVREWDKARKAEGRDPKAKFFSDPIKDRKVAQRKASSQSYGNGKKTYAELTADEKTQADDFINSYKQNTAVDPQGNPMSMSPENAQANGFVNPFQPELTNNLLTGQSLNPATAFQQSIQPVADNGQQSFAPQLAPEEKQQADSFIEKLRKGITNFKVEDFRKNTGEKLSKFFDRPDKEVAKDFYGDKLPNTVADWTYRPITRTAASTLSEFTNQKQVDPSLMGNTGKVIFGKEPVQSYSEGGKQIGESLDVKNPIAQAGISAALVALDFAGFKGNKKKIAEQAAKTVAENAVKKEGIGQIVKGKSKSITSQLDDYIQGTHPEAKQKAPVAQQLDDYLAGKHPEAPKAHDPEVLSKNAVNSFSNSPSESLNKPNRLQGDGFSFKEAQTGIAENGKNIPRRIIYGKDDAGNVILKDGRHLLEAYRQKGIKVPSEKIQLEDGLKLDDIISSPSAKNIGQKEILSPEPSPSVVRKEYTYTEGVTPKEQIVKTSKFAERVSEEVPKPLSDQLVETKYTPSRNIDVLNKVRDVIAQSEDDALKLARTENSVEGNAAATELIGKYIKEGQFEKAASLTKEVSPRFTKQGQQIQILSQYGKLTPEGSSRFLQKIVDEANDKLPTNKKINLKGVDLEEVAKQAEKIQGLTEGTRDYAVAVAQLMDTMASKIPATLGQKIATIQTMAQLLNPKTAIRNVVGNAFLGGAENVSDVVATGVDKVLGKTLFGGQRSIAIPSLSAQAKGATSGFKLGLEDALLGIDTGSLGTQFDLPNKTFRGGILGALEKGLNIELRATDRAFYKAAYDGALDSMKRASNVSKITPDMELRAGEEALYRTFQNNSVLAQGLSKLKKGLNKIGTPGGEFGLGDLINKYPKTPGNIVSVGVDYSPFGLIKAANNIVKVARGITNKGISSQREIAQNIGRAITGSGLIASGYVLAKNGIITGQKEKDIDIQQQYRETGQGPFKINLDALKRLTGGDDPTPKNGDTLVSYDWLQPNAIQFSMGANMAIGAKGAEDQLNTAVEGLSSGVDTITQQPVIKGVSDFFRTVSQTGGAAGIVKGLAGAATNAPSSFVPSLFNQIAQLRDNVARNTYSEGQVETAINKVKQRIPGFRETLRPQIGTSGKELEQYQNNTNSVFNVMFNPSFVSKIDESPEAKMILDIYEQSGETQQAPRLQDKTIRVNGQDIKLTSEQLEKMQRFVGEKTNKAFEGLVSSDNFQSLSDEDKAKKMSNIMTDIGKLAKVEILGDTGKAKTEEQIMLQGTVSQEKMKELAQPEEKGKLYSKYQDLAKNNPAEAKKLLNSMDYQAMEMFKKERTAARASHTRQVKAYLASDTPGEASRYLDTLEKEEKSRILNAMTPAMRTRYLEGKNGQ